MARLRRRSRVCRGPAAALLVACLAAAGLALEAPAASAAPPGSDPFYQPPSPLPAGTHGDILRSRRSNFTLDPVLNLPVPLVNSWQVLYRSETATGAPIAVSGTVLVPALPWLGSTPRPLVTYAVGTRGLGDDCAPSYTLTRGTDYEGLFIQAALNRGWAVAITDMEGLGTPGQHTYEVGRSQGKAVLDVARAATRLSGTGLSGTTPVGVMGYSQGGTSAGWAAQLAPTYTPELRLRGVVAGGVPADLDAVAEFLDGQLAFAFALLAAVGYDAAYPDLQLAGYLNAEGQQLLTEMQNICLVSVDGVSGLLGTAFKRISDYTTSNPLDTPIWQARLRENRLGSVKPTVPVFQPHALLDEIVPLGQADQLHKDWCALGANVTWKTYIAEHATGLVLSQPDSISFLADRFAGRATAGNC
jgi:Secretory lipase